MRVAFLTSPVGQLLDALDPRSEIVFWHQIGSTLVIDHQSFFFRCPIEATIAASAAYEFVS